jgi:hypothetical protein
METSLFDSFNLGEGVLVMVRRMTEWAAEPVWAVMLKGNHFFTAIAPVIVNPWHSHCTE